MYVIHNWTRLFSTTFSTVFEVQSLRSMLVFDIVTLGNFPIPNLVPLQLRDSVKNSIPVRGTDGIMPIVYVTERLCKDSGMNPSNSSQGILVQQCVPTNRQLHLSALYQINTWIQLGKFFETTVDAWQCSCRMVKWCIGVRNVCMCVEMQIQCCQFWFVCHLRNMSRKPSW